MGSNPIARSKHPIINRLVQGCYDRLDLKARRDGDTACRPALLGRNLTDQQNHTQDRCDAPSKTIELYGIAAPGLANERAQPGA